jgi:hypothetical protein
MLSGRSTFASGVEAGARMVDRLKDMPPAQRGDPQNVYAIAELMPTWSAWGQVLVDAGKWRRG